MMEYHLSTPLKEEDIRRFRIGDIVYLSGVMFTARDSGHERALSLISEGKELPLDLNGLAVYHCGPVVRKVGDRWEVVAAGPTTSARLEPLEPEFIEKTGVRLIIGKGGMGANTAEVCKRFGAVYAIFTGGAAVLAAKGMRRVIDVKWLDLGVPEAMWIIEADEFGPLMVAIDTTGANFYGNLSVEVERRLKEEIYPKIGF